MTKEHAELKQNKFNLTAAATTSGRREGRPCHLLHLLHLQGGHYACVPRYPLGPDTAWGPWPACPTHRPEAETWGSSSQVDGLTQGHLFSLFWFLWNLSKVTL